MLKHMEDMSGNQQYADINSKLIFSLLDINHTMRSLYEGKASQKRILIILSEVESITQRDLTVRLGIQPGSASEILSKLESAGLIRRTVSETDRRTANLSLTDEGERMALEAAKQRSQRHEEMFSCMSGDEKDQLLSLLEKLNEDWTRRYGAAWERKGKRHLHGCGQEHECEHRRECRHGNDHTETED